MKIILSVIALIAFVLVSMPMQSQAENTMPLVSETRVMKDGAIGCDTRDAYKGGLLKMQTRRTRLMICLKAMSVET